MTEQLKQPYGVALSFLQVSQTLSLVLSIQYEAPIRL